MRSRAATTTLDTEVLVIGSGAGGATTAAKLAAAGRTVMVVEEGPWVDPDAIEPFSLEEMVLKYRHRGSCATLGAPPVAYAEGRCVGGSTEINSGLWHRLPSYLSDEWRDTYRIEHFSEEVLDGYAEEVEKAQAVSLLPTAPPASSAALERGAAKLGWRAVEFPRVFKYDERGRGVKQTMARTMIPRAIEHGATVTPNCRVVKLLRNGDQVTGALCERRTPDGVTERVTINADHVFVCGGAIQTPGAAAAQRHPRLRRSRPEAASHDQDRGALREPHRSCRRADAPHHRVRAEPDDRRIGEPQGSHRVGAVRLRRGLHGGARRLGARVRLLRRHPRRRRRACSPFPGCARRSCRTG